MKSCKLGLAFASAVVLLVALAVGAVAASDGGVVHEVYPTGDPAQDVPNVQAAIDNADDGDTILLKAGTFNFGDWKTNPIPGGSVVIDKGVTVTGDGFDVNGNPRTIIQGGGYRQKNHWENCEWGVVTFGGDASGGVLENVWLKEPHFYAVFASGFCGQNHAIITIRKVKITDISVQANDWADVLAEVETSKWSDIILFRFIRSQGTVGELAVRDFHARVKDLKAGKGYCITAGVFSDEAKRFVEARLIDLIEKQTLMGVLHTIDTRAKSLLAE